MPGFDQEGELLRRLLPPVAYEPNGSSLDVTVAAVDLTYQLFASYAKRRVEAGCFWYGERDGNRATVRAVVVPPQKNHRGHYAVSASAMSLVSEATLPRGWKNLAQLHTHPGEWVEHSSYDDQHANSRRALSLVLPYYGAQRSAWPDAVGVHECQGGYWHMLSPESAKHRVVTIRNDSAVELVDLR